MGLPIDGNLSIKDAEGDPRSIALEVDGNLVGNKTLYTLGVTAGMDGDGKVKMTEFHGYSATFPLPTPVITSLIFTSTEFTATWRGVVPAGSIVVYHYSYDGDGSDINGSSDSVSSSGSINAPTGSTRNAVDVAGVGNTNIKLVDTQSTQCQGFPSGGPAIVETDTETVNNTVSAGTGCSDDGEGEVTVFLTDSSTGIAHHVTDSKEVSVTIDPGIFNMNMTFTVYATDTTGAWSQSGTATETALSYPAPPANLIASNITTGSITWSWDDMQGAGPQLGDPPTLSYKSTVTGFLPDHDETNDTFRIAGGLGAGSSYNFDVSTVNVVGESAQSSDTQTTLPPAMPTNLQDTSQTPSSITWNWDDMDGATSYDWRITLATGGGNVSSGNATNSIKTVTGLNSGTSYTFYVKSKSFAATSSEASDNGTTESVTLYSIQGFDDGSNWGYNSLAVAMTDTANTIVVNMTLDILNSSLYSSGGPYHIVDIIPNAIFNADGIVFTSSYLGDESGSSWQVPN